MSAQQKYLYQYAYLDGSSFNAVENNNLYNDERGAAEILQNYNHNSLNLNFKAGEHTAKALSVLLANSEVGLILKPVKHGDLVNTNIDVYDLVKIGNINLSPNIHFYEVGGEFLSNQINNVDFLTSRTVLTSTEHHNLHHSVTIKYGENTYTIRDTVLAHGITSFYYPTGDEEGAPVALVDLRDMDAFSITFNGNAIPANFLSGFVNADCVMTITNAGSIMKIGDNAFANSEFANVIANFSGIRELGSGVKLAKTGGEITTANPLGLVAYDGLKITLTNDVKEIDGLIIASPFFASGSKKLLNDNCNALSHFKGTLTEIKNSTIVEDFADLTNINKSACIFDNCTFEVNQDFSGNVATRTLTIKNCNQESTGEQVFKFTGFAGTIKVKNSFKSVEASYVVDDAAAYALKIDNDSFINAGENSGSLNKVLSNENRELPTLEGNGAFLQINNNNIVSFSGNSFLTTSGTILTINEITSVVFQKTWDLSRGDFSYAYFDLPNLYLRDFIAGFSNLLQMINGAFYKISRNPATGLRIFISATQFIQILQCDNCLTSEQKMFIDIYNDLPDNFNYLSIARKDTSFIFDETSVIDVGN
ncbi:MAG TPA: hypothetical protein PKW37_10205, partial [Salinivirgaceae bacterium]|nr:hypothetical protein [Salinivirgaceae bacterium]